MVSRISFCSHLRNLCSLRNDIIGPLEVQTDTIKLQPRRGQTRKPSLFSLSLFLSFCPFFFLSFVFWSVRNEKLQKLALRYLSVCPYGRFRQPPHGISWYLMLGGLTDICRYVPFFVKIRKIKHFYTKTQTRVCAHLEGDLLKIFIGASNISSRNCREKQSMRL